MAEISQNVVLVTGANGALGQAIVRRLSSSGTRVVALERSKEGDVQLERESEVVLRLRASTTDAAALAGALARAESEQGLLSGAVLTAGAWRGGHKFHELAAAADYRAVMDANLESANVALRAILPGMVQRQRGSVVLIGSLSGVRPYNAPGSAAYAAAKAAVTALSQAIAAEVLADGVRVNLVLPSTIDTEANRQAMPDADRSTWVSTESLGGVVDFLLSERARDISGAALPVYGRANV
ncbi:MAG: short-chain dehydrogenase/reductase [Polyangiaceae bacterium]|jgi:NAD(P)-dependent dehydrogenase (short-subunit alcohol dehydrogenase family)|nr:short-chain dehydrogenase/reductase [Polyangiaceae bacterium]